MKNKCIEKQRGEREKRSREKERGIERNQAEKEKRRVSTQDIVSINYCIFCYL